MICTEFTTKYDIRHYTYSGVVLDVCNLKLIFVILSPKSVVDILKNYFIVIVLMSSKHIVKPM